MCHDGSTAPSFKTIHGGGYDPKIYATDGTRYSTTFVVTIDSATDGRLWQAQAVGALVRTDSLTLTRRMIPGLVDAIGKTVKREKFPLR